MSGQSQGEHDAMTVFRTPMLAFVLRHLARAVLFVIGWRVVGQVPTAPRYVLIAAPHTSNWDFPLMLLAVLSVGIDLHWMGKDALFRRPFGGLMRWLGGISIDRSQPNQTVQQMVDRFEDAERLIVLIPPEGTRARVERWKTGFYHIACGAGVPILLGFIDAPSKQLGFGPVYQPERGIEYDLPRIQAYYKDKGGIHAE